MIRVRPSRYPLHVYIEVEGEWDNISFLAARRLAARIVKVAERVEKKAKKRK